MYRMLLNGKIHRATVTQADLNYVGSITIDAELMAHSRLVEGERVSVVDITNGARLETYVIAGDTGSGVVGINGAAAHLVHPGDKVIIMSFVGVDEAERVAHRPSVVHVDDANRVVGQHDDPARPGPAAAERDGRRSAVAR